MNMFSKTSIMYRTFVLTTQKIQPTLSTNTNMIPSSLCLSLKAHRGARFEILHLVFDKTFQPINAQEPAVLNVAFDHKMTTGLVILELITPCRLGQAKVRCFFKLGLNRLGQRKILGQRRLGQRKISLFCFQGHLYLSMVQSTEDFPSASSRSTEKILGRRLGRRKMP